MAEAIKKQRGGKRPGAGRPRKPKPESVVDRGAAAKLIAALNSPRVERESAEIAGWRELWDAEDGRVRLDTRKYLYDKRDGKAMHTVNHLHDKPLEVNMTHSLSERFRIAMEKAEKRVNSLR